jgi:Protein of unknown function (DUF3307)
MTLTAIVFLYLAFRAKQVACDFFFQTQWMAITKGKPAMEGGLRALAAHVAIHGAGTLLVTLVFAPGFWWLCLLDMAIHGAIDRAKAVLTLKRGWTVKDKYYWWAFGLDQEAHNLTHLCYIVFIAAAQ